MGAAQVRHARKVFERILGGEPATQDDLADAFYAVEAAARVAPMYGPAGEQGVELAWNTLVRLWMGGAPRNGCGCARNAPSRGRAIYWTGKGIATATGWGTLYDPAYSAAAKRSAPRRAPTREPETAAGELRAHYSPGARGHAGVRVPRQPDDERMKPMASRAARKFRNDTAALPAVPSVALAPPWLSRSTGDGGRGKRGGRSAAAGAVKSALAMTAGGAAGALLGGVLVRAGGSPKWAAGILTVAGLAGAIYFKGAARAAAAGAGAAGAGQVALALLARRSANQAPPAQLPPQQAQRPGVRPRPRQGLDVDDAFQDARRQAAGDAYSFEEASR